MSKLSSYGLRINNNASIIVKNNRYQEIYQISITKIVIDIEFA